MYKLIRPFVFLQDCERAHDRVLKVGRLAEEEDLTGVFELFYGYDDPALQTTVCGINFENPVGLAAGYDKNAVVCRFTEGIGFGYSEIGSVTYHGGKGNPQPRLFRLVEDEAAINRMGLNNHGAHRINENLRRRRSEFPIGVNIAKTHSKYITGDDAIRDFLESYRTMTQGDYVVVNISCPNTNEKTFEDPKALEELLSGFNDIKDGRPLFVKLSPDLTLDELGNILQVCEDQRIDGYVTTNTSSKREGLKTSPRRIIEIGKGGLSGRPIRQKSTDMVKRVYIATKKPIIGVGGIFTAQDAYEKIRAGAVLVQVLTGMVYEGLGIAKQINKGLVEIARREGVKHIRELVGQ
jgi:dihydroorotate dehydrogenase